jgi:hypothetical protein
VVPLAGGGVARFYLGEDGIVLGELETADRSAAVAGRELGKIDVFAVLQEIQPLR